MTGQGFDRRAGQQPPGLAVGAPVREGPAKVRVLIVKGHTCVQVCMYSILYSGVLQYVFRSLPSISVENLSISGFSAKDDCILL